MTTDYKYLLIIVILLYGLTISGCATTTPLTPSQTAQQFWHAVLENDMETAQKYTTKDSMNELKESKLDLADATVGFGDIKIQDKKATIATSITFPEDIQGKNAAFTTFIEKEDGSWMVNFSRTQIALAEASKNRRLSDIFSDLQNYSKEFSGSLDELVKKWKQASPELRKDLETLGDATKEEVDEAIKQLAPEIKEGIEDFRDSIAEALKQLKPKQPEEEKKKDPNQKLI